MIKPRSMSAAMRVALLERENSRLKLLVARLAEWSGFPTGTRENSSSADTMTLIVEFPNGVVHFPVEKRYAFGIWHEFSEKDDDPDRDMTEFRVNQLIAGVVVRTLRTYWKPEDEEEAETNEPA